ncbi:Receptor-type tyrosine-protein phosphatase alpha [Geodia barretti]|uniref:Receptor-type tyrosine-protein phosphatase alpha n=1 Tax=Geodia barretti TaxID=519541 RepID=A0AA35SID1_GEOBA|nr:Receptor-type tyrosine-protein phosphatase alpha [Geodia barretti]
MPSFDPILAEVFGDYVTRCHSSDNRDFKHQFTVMQDCGAGFSTIAGSNTSLQKLNRYKNIMPYDDNRVFLMAVEGHTEYKGDYINASYIDAVFDARCLLQDHCLTQLLTSGGWCGRRGLRAL